MITYSIARQFKDKACLTGDRTTFTATRGNILDLAAAVKRGYSFAAPTFSGDYRKQKNFIVAQMGVLDMDKLTGDEYARLRALPELFHAALIYETPSHTETAPRCRIVFVLPVPVANIDEYRIILTFIVHHFEALGFTIDKASKTPPQPWYGSTGGRQWVQESAILPADLLSTWRADYDAHIAAELEAKRHDAPAARMSGNTGELSAALVADVIAALGVDTSNTNSEGYTRQPVKCPLKNHEHDATRPAFYWNVAGHFGKCHKCHSDRETVNTHDTARALGIDPDTYYRKKHAATNQPVKLLERIKPVSLPDFQADLTLKLRYFSDIDLTALADKRAVVGRSPLNTGKTELIKRYIAGMERAQGRPVAVLYLTHVCALAGDIAARFADSGFELYSDFGGDTAQYIPAMSKLICSYNSLWKLAKGERLPRFDLIVIDEVTQFHNHLFGGTFRRNQAIKAYTLLKDLIGDAGQIIIMDAHATDIESDWLRAITGEVYRIDNTYTHPWGALTLHDRAETVLSAALAALDGNMTKPENERRPVIIPTYKERSELYARLIKDRYPAARVMVINSDTSHSAEAQAFLRDINRALADVDVLICSPSMATGIDVQAQVFGVYAIIPNMVQPGHWTKPADVLQMICRYRNASERHIYVMPGQHTSPTDWAELYHQEMTKLEQTTQAADYQSEGLTTPGAHHGALKLWCMMKAHQNRMTADLLSSFVHLARLTGFEVAAHEGRDTALRTALKATKETIAAELKAAIMAAAPVDHDEYEFHQRAGTMTPAIRNGHGHYKIVDSVGLSMTAQLYDDLHTSAKRATLRAFTLLTMSPRQAQELDRVEAAQNKLIMTRNHHAMTRRLLTGLFAAVLGNNAPLFGPDNPEWMDAPDVKQRAAIFLADNLADIHRYVDHRADLSTDPLAVLRRGLARIGVKLERQQIMRAGDRFMQYRIDADSLAQMHTYALARMAHLAQKAITTNAEKHIYTRVCSNETVLDRLAARLNPREVKKAPQEAAERAGA